MAHEALKREQYEGFDGSIAGLSLTDLIQLKGTSRFSGCISVEFGGRQGVIFFRDGHVVHAEKGGYEGEEAFHRIMRWPGGRFTARPNLSPLRYTIRKSWQHLLLDTHRATDERQRRMEPNAAAQTDTTSLRDRIRRLEMVTDVITVDSNGIAVDGSGPSADILAGRARFLARLGDRIGTRLGVGSVTSVVLEGKSEHLFIYTGKRHFMVVTAGAENQAATVEEAIRLAVHSP